MDSLNLSWRGQMGSGKRTHLLKALKQVADSRGLPFNIQIKQFQMQMSMLKNDTAGHISTTADEDVSDKKDASSKDSFPYESSLVHIGFDIARMSMQDKVYLKPILQRWGIGSQVLTGTQEHSSRILVFYHSHLFSTESCYLLHSVLEDSFGDLSLWFTSELPVPHRLSDYFVEIPVSIVNIPQDLTVPIWNMVFKKLLIKWMNMPFPTLSETTHIRAFIYELLMRNLRWMDCVHIIFDVMLILPISESKRASVFDILAKQEATAGGQTIPSYRIPLLWEALFLDIREAICCSSDTILDGRTTSDSIGFKNVSKRSKTSLQPATNTVEKQEAKPKRSTGNAKRSTTKKPV